MAATVGSVIFVVVVVGGMGSLAGAFLASLLIGVIQTFAVAFDYSLGALAQRWACTSRLGAAFGSRCGSSRSRRSRPSCRTCSWC
jgi:branched-chain amino acid transport system permease protein